MNDYAESLLVHFRRVESLKNDAVHYVSIDLNKRQLCDLELLINRAYYPLKGYLNQKDYESVVDNMRLTDGTLWPMPICLDISEDDASKIKIGNHVALRDQEGFLLGVLTIDDIFRPDKKEAKKIFGTDNPDQHEGVRIFFEKVKDVYIGGNIEGIHLPVHYDFKYLRLTPSETHRKFSLNGWRKVIGFHVESPVHCREKEMSLLAAREAGGSIFMQPAVGLRHPGDLTHYTLVRCHQEIAKKYPRNIIHLGLISLHKRNAGPREALWQAIIRKNYGCTHFMVFDDHADPNSMSEAQERYYPLNAAQKLVAEYEEDTGIKMVPLKNMVYSEDRAQYIPEVEVSPAMNIKEISLKELKRRLEYDLNIPQWFSYPEVVNELKYANPPRYKQGFTIFMTGLSGAGKSTLAKILLVKFLEMRNRPVTLLDGDIVRKNLSSELNFSKDHRDLNIRRIGFVASEITKNGGIAICAPIAPYEASRRHNRELIAKYGGFIEVYISTSIEICEQRDRKGIYAKARAGIMKGVTGIDDPYIPPENPEITIDTTEMTPEEAAQEVMLYLEEKGYIR